MARDKERRAVTQKAYREVNRERLAIWAKAYHEAHRDEARANSLRHGQTPASRARVRAWAARNRPLVNANNARYSQQPHVRMARADREEQRRARRHHVGAELVDRFLVWFLSAGRCGICGLHVDVETMHVDHVIPLCKGGLHVLANLQPAHAVCNLRKGGR